MSYFSDNGGNQTPNGEPTGGNEDFVKQLVDAKGDSWADPQVIAKGKLESDAHIKGLEDQLKELRGELDKQDYANELLEKLQATGKSPAGTGAAGDTTPSGSEQVGTQPQFGESELKSLVLATLESKSLEDTKASNLSKVDAKLKELYGTEVDKVMDARSAELGMDKERLQALASESPQAFFKLIGEEVRKEANPAVHGTINTSASSFSPSNERDWNYYQKLRREDRRAYFSPSTQKQMLADKIRLGDKFGN